MRTHFSSSSGFSMTSVLVSMGIAGLISMILMQNMDNLRTISDSERNMQMRTELFQSMSQLTNLVDCSATISGVDTSEIPPKGKKVSLIQQGSGDILVSTLGTRRGLFSYVADIMPDSSIRLRAAAFKRDTENPRAAIDSGNDDLFLKVGKRVWDFEFTGMVKDKYFPSLAILCQGASLAAGIPPGATVSCVPHFNIDMRAGGAAPVRHGLGSKCLMIDPLTNFACAFDTYIYTYRGRLSGQYTEIGQRDDRRGRDGSLLNSTRIYGFKNEDISSTSQAIIPVNLGPLNSAHEKTMDSSHDEFRRCLRIMNKMRSFSGQ